MIASKIRILITSRKNWLSCQIQKRWQTKEVAENIETNTETVKINIHLVNETVLYLLVSK